MKRTRLRVRWADLFAVLAFSAVLTAFLVWGGLQVPPMPVEPVSTPTEGQP